MRGGSRYLYRPAMKEERKEIYKVWEWGWHLSSTTSSLKVVVCPNYALLVIQWEVSSFDQLYLASKNTKNHSTALWVYQVLIWVMSTLHQHWLMLDYGSWINSKNVLRSCKWTWLITKVRKIRLCIAFPKSQDYSGSKR